MSDPEFSRPLRLDTLGGAPRELTIDAEPEERTALARRFELRAIGRLTATLSVTREGEAVNVAGRLEADVVQACVASGDPVPATITEPFTVRFVPEALGPTAEEVELDQADLDLMTYEGGQVDVGEAVAQTLALALDPFPRSPGAESALREAGVIGEDESGPFSALKALKDKLGGS